MVVPSKMAIALIHVPVTRRNLRKLGHLIHVQFEINFLSGIGSEDHAIKPECLE